MSITLRSFIIFWIVQASAVLIFFVPFTWGLVGLWAASHFLRAIGLIVLVGLGWALFG